MRVCAGSNSREVEVWRGGISKDCNFEVSLTPEVDDSFIPGAALVVDTGLW